MNNFPDDFCRGNQQCLGWCLCECVIRSFDVIFFIGFDATVKEHPSVY